MKMFKVLFFSLVLSIPTCLGMQVGSETGLPRQPGGMYPREWPPGPGRDSVPAWAKPGTIRFARWDGGRIETAKAFLSGWPGFNPPIPDYLFTMTNWYEPPTVLLLRDAAVNMVWVTFSNGFSLETERNHQEQLHRYIAECHRQGIHVMAYESIANIFWEDMFEHVPQSRNWVQIGAEGKPVPYGAGDYSKMGRVTRYMADLSNPQWREYLRKRVALAIDAGADGVQFDNNFGSHLLDVYRDIYAYGAACKKDFLLMGNFHQASYSLNRLTNCMTTEDGAEPGVYEQSHLQGRRWRQDASSLVPVNGGRLVTNIGLFRIYSALSQGWKLALVEDGGREVGQRETTPMSADRQQLALAEAMSFGVSLELFSEGAFANGLFNHDPSSMAIWRAIGKCNRFFAEHERYYTEMQSLAPLAIVLDDRSESVSLLDGLAARNVLFDVVYEHDLTAAKLAPYTAVALLTARTVRQRALSVLESFVMNGGKLYAAGDAATFDESGEKRSRPAWFGERTGKGECAYSERIPPWDELAKTLRDAVGIGPIEVEAPAGVLYNVVQQAARGRTMVHLLNYTLKPSAEIKVRLQKKYAGIRWLSPEGPQEIQLAASPGTPTELKLPPVRIYSLLVLEAHMPGPSKSPHK